MNPFRPRSTRTPRGEMSPHERSITSPEFWPPGSIMTYEVPTFRGHGLVVANTGTVVLMMWAWNCANPGLTTYEIACW